jgi:hypothetical protein
MSEKRRTGLLIAALFAAGAVATPVAGCLFSLRFERRLTICSHRESSR